MDGVRMGLCASLLLAVGVWLAPRPAQACGGLFCNRAQPVNQAAERIVFAKNADGSVTAVIEIQYEGPSQSFSWVLPVPGVPKVAVSSTLAFDRLQQLTDPQYNVQATFDDSCGGAGALNARSAAGGTSAIIPAADHVTVLASGSVGPYDYTVITLDPNLAAPADAAVQWLMQNGYDVTDLGPSVLGPYLEDGLNLIAFRLSKDSMTGSIRPILITYDAQLPSIPIRPTAVAADDDMGVLVWVLGEARAIPQNYKALELNEALIDWFNPMDSYDAVVSAAADEAGGQGFVTELAQSSDSLADAVLQPYERQAWQRISSQQYGDPVAFVSDAQASFGGWDGFSDALADAVTLPAGVSVSDFAGCPRCYASQPGFAFDDAAFLKSLFEKVYKPMDDTQKLLSSLPYVTRLYTTMSADEMTVDPAFDFNPDAGDVSNQHTAMQTIGCDQSWTMVLPQGDVVVGRELGVWPSQAAKGQPAARKILQLATQGKGTVMLDNSAKITKLLAKAAADQGVKVVSGADGGPPVVLKGGSSGGCSAMGSSTSQASAGAWLLGLLSWCGLWWRRRGRS